MSSTESESDDRSRVSARRGVSPQLSGRQVFPRDTSNRRAGIIEAGDSDRRLYFSCARGETGSGSSITVTLPKKRYRPAMDVATERGRTRSARTNSQARPISRPGRRSLGKTRGPTLGNRAVRFVSFHSSFPSPFLKILHEPREKERESVWLSSYSNRLGVLGGRKKFSPGNRHLAVKNCPREKIEDDPEEDTRVESRFGFSRNAD